MLNGKYHVCLAENERAELRHMISRGKAAAASLVHARILLKTDRGPSGPALSDSAVAAAVECDETTVYRVKRRCAEEGLESALVPKPKGHRPRKLDGEQEAKLIAVACSQAPDGRDRWTMQLLADKLVELKIIDSISDESVRRTMKKKRAEAMAEEAMGYSAGEKRRLRRCDGGRSRRLQAAL